MAVRFSKKMDLFKTDKNKWFVLIYSSLRSMGNFVEYNICFFSVEGKSWLSEQWKLCSPLAADSDVTILKNWLAEIYVDLAMINYPYPANFLTPLPGNPIKVNSIIRDTY